MQRRELVYLFGGAAAAWPLRVRAQHPSMPVIGYLSSRSAASNEASVVGFRKGLKETGFVEGENLKIEYRWADGEYERLPEMAADLVGRRVAVILATGGSDPGRAAKAATVTIPIIFLSSSDPVVTGLVASLNRPGGNVTGVSMISSALEAKRLELLHDLVPKVATIAVIINPKYLAAQSQRQDVEAAATLLGVKVVVLTASTEREIDVAFAALVQQGAGALLVAQDPFLVNSRERLVLLANRHAVPLMYGTSAAVLNGALVSYGPDFADGIRHAGIYVGKILKGAKPADLPVMQPTKFELVINMKTAKALGLIIPPSILARADEVIE